MEREGHTSQNQESETGVLSLLLPLAQAVTLGKGLTFSRPQFPHLCDEGL